MAKQISPEELAKRLQNSEAVFIIDVRENGEVVFVIHEGTGAEFSRDPGQFWSHKWNLLSALYYGKYYETGEPADAII